MPNDVIPDTEQTGLSPTSGGGGLWSRVSSMFPGIAHALQRAAPYIQAAAPAIQSIGENFVAAGGTPLQQQSLQASRQNRLQAQELGDRRLLLASQLQSGDLDRQLKQQELDSYQNPQAKQAMGLDTLQKQLQLQRQYAQPEDIVGAVEGQPGQLGHFTQRYNPETKGYDVTPTMVSRQSIVSSPDAPKVPYDPTKTITRTQRSQLLAASKSAGAALIEPDQSSTTGYSHVWRDAQGNEIGRAANALPPAGFVPKTTTGSSTRVIQTDHGPQVFSAPSSSTVTPSLPGLVGSGARGGAASSSPTVRPIQDSQGNQVKPQVTAASRSMAEAAPHVLSFINRIEPLVRANVGNTGPLAGRWSDFWTGKIGEPDPSYNALRVNDGLLSTLLMRMHTGSRGAVQMQEHFRDLLGLAHQSPENYLAALDEIKKYANDLMGGTGGSDAAPAPGNSISLEDFLKER